MSGCLFHNIIIVVLIVLLAGCARQPKIAIDICANSRLSPPLAQKLSGTRKISTLMALVEAEVEYRGSRRRFDVALVAKAPDSIRMEFMDRLAGSLVSIISTPERFVYMDSSGFDMYSGQEGRERFKEATGLPWTPEEAIRILMGGIPVTVSLSAEYPRDAEGRYWVEDKMSSVGWQDETAMLSFLEVDEGRIKQRVDYSGYTKKGRVEFPNKISISVFSKRTKIILNYKEVEINAALAPDVFRVIEHKTL